MFDDLFGPMFDLDGDGRVSEEEELLGIYVLSQMEQEDEARRRAQQARRGQKPDNKR